MNWILTHSIILVIIGLAELGLAIYFWMTAGDRVRRYFALFVLGVSMWVFTSGLANILYSELRPISQATILNNHFLFWGPVIALSSLLIVTWLFPFPSYAIEAPAKLVLLFPILLFGLLIFFTDTIVVSVSHTLPYESVVYGQAYPYFILFVLVYYFWSLITLIRKYRIAVGFQKAILSKFLIGIAGSGVIGVYTNGLMPLLFNDQSLWWLGPEASIIWLSITGYVMLKK